MFHNQTVPLPFQSSSSTIKQQEEEMFGVLKQSISSAIMYIHGVLCIPHEDKQLYNEICEEIKWLLQENMPTIYGNNKQRLNVFITTLNVLCRKYRQVRH